MRKAIMPRLKHQVLRLLGLRPKVFRADILRQTRHPVRPARPRPGFASWAVLAIVAAILAAVLVAAVPNRSERPTKAASLTVERGDDGDDRVKANQERAPSALSVAKPGAMVLAPPHDVIDAITLRSANRDVRLADIMSPEVHAVCVGDEGDLWACGLQARAFLHYLVRDKEIECLPRGSAEVNPVMAKCRAADLDLAHALVAEGWARPFTPGGEYDRHVQAAAESKRGVWRGGWRIRARS